MKKRNLPDKKISSIEEVVTALSDMLVVDNYTVQNMVTMRLHPNYRLSKLFGGLVSNNPDYPEIPLVGLVEIINFLYKDTGKKIVPVFNSVGTLKKFQLEAVQHDEGRAS